MFGIKNDEAPPAWAGKLVQQSELPLRSPDSSQKHITIQEPRLRAPLPFQKD